MERVGLLATNLGHFFKREALLIAKQHRGPDVLAELAEAGGEGCAQPQIVDRLSG